MTQKNKSRDEFSGFRSFGPGTYTEEKDKDGAVTQRKVRATICSENPVEVYDYYSDEIIREILCCSGMRLPANGQLPLLDNHSRWSGSSSVKGSVRNISPEGNLVAGDIFFSSTAADIATLAREGHLTDLSVGYRTFSEHTTWLEPGEERACDGKTYKNEDAKKRLAIRTVWEPREVSTTPIGADEMAKFRSLNDNHLYVGERTMNLKEKTVETTGKQEPDLDSIRAAARKEAAEAERARVLEIQTCARELNIGDEFIKDFVDKGTPALEARMKCIQEAQRKLAVAPPAGSNVSVGKDETDKFRGAAVTGLLLRSGFPTDKIDSKEREAVEKSEFRGSTMQHLARHILDKSGMRGVVFMDNRQVADAIIDHSKRAVAQGTGDFSYILAAAANKFLLNRYIETPTTYQLWVGFKPLDDFKQNSLVNYSEFSDIDLWPEGTPPKWGRFQDKGEYITLYKYGKAFTISYEALVNDDKGAFSDIPSRIGGACARKRNRIAYSLLYRGNTAGTGSSTVGPTMNEDSKAMFHSDHGNLLSAAAPSVANLGIAAAALKTIKLLAPDADSATQYTNAAIKSLICAVAKEHLWKQVINSESCYDNPTSGANQQPNTGMRNPFFGQGIQIVPEPIIDELSSTAWYVAADPNQVAHIVFGTLGGQNAPIIRNEPNAIGAAAGISYEVMDVFSAAAGDWRGIVKNPGA